MNDTNNKTMTPNRTIAQLALVVADYDEAIAFYTHKLGFVLVEDTRLSDTKRWVVIRPEAGATGCCLLLAKAANPQQLSAVGNQAGGRVFLFLQVADFWENYNAFVAAGVEFVRPPAVEAYGTVAVFKDLYGNLWDLIGPAKQQ
jgi:catechol 2,3-dioxygenase-like lactoylglutathione lyase family enzyme